jgi:hypothetical protein
MPAVADSPVLHVFLLLHSCTTAGTTTMAACWAFTCCFNGTHYNSPPYASAMI